MTRVVVHVTELRAISILGTYLRLSRHLRAARATCVGEANDGAAFPSHR